MQSFRWHLDIAEIRAIDIGAHSKPASESKMNDRNVKWCCLGLGFSLISGCSLWKSEPVWPWTPKELPCNSVCTNDDAVKSFTAAMTYCIALQNYHAKNGGVLNSGRFVMAATGTLAGAVFAPLASGSASTAWSGLSGSTNALQSSLDENFSSVLAVKRRSSVAKAGKDALESFPGKADPDVRVYASVAMAFNCAVAGADVDSAAIRAITGAEINNPSVNQIDGSSAR